MTANGDDAVLGYQRACKTIHRGTWNRRSSFLAHRISAPCDGNDYVHRDLFGTASARKGTVLGASEYDEIVRRFLQDWPTYVRMNLDEVVLARSKALLERYPLRTLDAIHLASAIELQSHLEESSVLIRQTPSLLLPNASKSNVSPCKTRVDCVRMRMAYDKIADLSSCLLTRLVVFDSAHIDQLRCLAAWHDLTLLWIHLLAESNS